MHFIYFYGEQNQRVHFSGDAIGLKSGHIFYVFFQGGKNDIC